MTKPPFPYKSPPFAPYQRDIFRATWAAPYWFYALEQGTGKTWIAINGAAALYLADKIDGMVVLAPNGVHAEWIRDQIPNHMPEVVPVRTHLWVTSKETAKASKRQREKGHVRRLVKSDAVAEMIEDRAHFAILAVNSEVIGVHRAADAAVERMLKMRRCLLVVDESGDFANPSAKRTRRLLRWRMLAPYRRCLDGTPSGGSPFDLYAPYRFLNPSILGLDSIGAMKMRYAEWERQEVGYGESRRSFPKIKKVNGVKQYKNLDQLRARIAPVTSRVTKVEALPHLPAKLFNKRYFTLTPEQRRLTNELITVLRASLGNGKTVTAELELVQYLRRQQIACGYVPVDPVWSDEEWEDGQPLEQIVEPVHIIPGPNPRLELLVEELLRADPTRNPTIVWTRFKFDIELLAPRLEMEGWRVGVYSGETSTRERIRVREAFQNRELDIFLGNPAAGGRGLNLWRATRVFYYANYFGLRRRLQSEDRAHRIGTTENVLYTDIIGTRSVDEMIVRSLRSGKNVADAITGDPTLTDWL